MRFLRRSRIQQKRKEVIKESLPRKYHKSIMEAKRPKGRPRDRCVRGMKEGAERRLN